jgi:Zn-dependent metalloprotease
MKGLMPVILMLFIVCEGAAAAAERPERGVVEMFDFDGNFGTLTRASSGVPRAKPAPAREALDRWRVSAKSFAHGFAVSRGGNGTESFSARRVYEDEIGQAHVRMAQTIAGLPVVGVELIVHADFQTGRILGVHGRFAIDRGLPRSPRLNAGDAITATMREYGLDAAHVTGLPALTYIVDDQSEVRLTWTNLVSYSSENGLELDRLYSDALTGRAVARHPQIRRAKNREIYDCLDQSNWNGCVFLFDEGGSSSDPKAMAAYANAGIAWDYFSSKHARNGVDGNGGVLRQAINFGSNNSGETGWFPDGTFAIVYADDFGVYSPPPVYSPDIVAHEFTHGVIHHEANLTYVGETAGIEEGFADLFAVATSYQASAPDWWIADDTYLLADAVRYLNDPARKSNHADYYPARESGDPHRNAGITGLAFYLLSAGGSHPRRPSVTVSGQGIGTAEKIFYQALTAYMTSTTNFYALQGYTLKAASSLYGFQSVQYQAVADAWHAVGNHWEVYGTNPAPGKSWTSAPYTTSSYTKHTAQLTGSNFDLYLERLASDGSTWNTYVSATGTGSTKRLDPSPNPGTFRWRVHKARGTGSTTLFELAWNHAQ